MARVVIVRGADCVLTADELVKRFSKYYPQNVEVLDPAGVGEEIEKLRGSYPVIVAGSRADRAVAHTRSESGGHVCIGIAHGKISREGRSYEVDAAVADIAGEGAVVMLCVFEREEMLAFFLESPGEIYSADTSLFAETVSEIVWCLDSERTDMLQ